MKNKIIMMFLSGAILITLSGCDEKTSGYVSGGTKEPSSTEENVETNVKEEPVKEENKEKETEVEKVTEDKKVTEDVKSDEKTMKTVKVYFSDDQAENLVEKEMDIELGEGENLEQKIVESLKVKSEDSSLYNTIEENIKFNSVKVEDKVAIVDISSENLSGGSNQEIFLVDSIVAALTSLENIDGVKFLVDGKEAETLMGHIEVTDVKTRDQIGTNIVK